MSTAIRPDSLSRLRLKRQRTLYFARVLALAMIKPFKAFQLSRPRIYLVQERSSEGAIILHQALYRLRNTLNRSHSQRIEVRDGYT